MGSIKYWTAIAVLVISVPGRAFSTAEDRIKGAPDDTRALALQQNVHERAKLGVDRGALDPGTEIRGMKLLLASSERQRGALAQLIEEQRNPASTDYRNWLTPAQYGERFGLSEGDLARMVSWLQSSGFVIEQVARARNWISFGGSAGQIAKTFRAELHRVEADGEVHFANVTEPWIPEALSGVVSHISGLNDFRPRPTSVKARTQHALDSLNGNHYLSPVDFATIYNIASLYNSGFNGTGQKLVIAGQTDINLADIRAFRQNFNLPANDPVLVLTGTDPGTSAGDQVEADLDLEWSGAVAPNAAIIYVYSQNVFDSIEYAIDQNLAPVISLSYSGCEVMNPTAFFQALAQQANAQGLTWVNSSGDTGAAGCDSGTSAINGPIATFPASIPEVTGVGGTEFVEAGGAYWGSQSALSYIPEKAWNDTALAETLEASGGAASVMFAKPWWQVGPGVPNDAARDVPDVALAGSAEHDGYLIYNNGQMMVVGGTSAGTPAFAGILAILNQYLGQGGLGNINPQLYNLASQTKGLFHDVTAGDNMVPCTAGTRGCESGHFGFPTATAYDLATGLGSVDAYNLVTNWASLPTPVATTLTLSASAAAISTTTQVQVTAMVTGPATPSGTVAFSVAGVPLGTAALSGSGSKATATLTVMGSSLPLGADTITASYGAVKGWASVYVAGLTSQLR
jgi:subtilase family serine protease